MKPKALIIVLDGVGVGALPDAVEYRDAGSDTLGNLARALGGLSLPNLQSLGLGNILSLEGVPPAEHPRAFYGRMAEQSVGKDSTSGHWELAGRARVEPPAFYPDGFPPQVIEAFIEKIGMAPLGNKPASGTMIIQELGREHIATGRPIIYTSADSVLQIAAHVNVTPVEELYRICRVVRDEIMNGNPWRIDRVIARPFAGEPNKFTRLKARRDFSAPPPFPTLLDLASEAGIKTFGVGKVDDLFGHRGISDCSHTKSNAEGLSHIKRLLLENRWKNNKILIFANLIDFDQEYGHRRNPEGFRDALEEFDAALPGLLELLDPQDFFAITADHGCDPTFIRSTDHTREYAPALAMCGSAGEPCGLGTRRSFADLGATVAEFLELPPTPDGTSFWREMQKKAKI
ncbi:MAG: phosphopentomutase [bacterium]